MRKLLKKGIGVLFASLLATGLVVVVGCGDDDGGNGEMCGNGIVEGAEECDGDDLNGHDCTTLGQGFTGGELACHDYCLFDTSGCTGGSEDCGNGVVDSGEECDGDDLNDQTCEEVGNYVGGTLSCNNDCTFDTGACEADEDCGNGIIDEGEDCDGDNLGDNECADVGDFTGGTLSCADDCSFDTSECSAGGTASEQIAQARDTADGTVEITIDGAYVTYLKPEVENDPPGFAIQAEQAGPAIYINIDPATLNPQPQVGDEVTFTVTELSTLWGQRHISALEGWTVNSSGFDVSTLVQDITDETDVISSLEDYTMELVSATAEIVGEFGFAGTGYIAAQIETNGISGNEGYLLRLPVALNDQLGLEIGCTVQILGTPLWRFETDAQISAWTVDDIAIASCPAPIVTGAMAVSETSVAVTFNRLIDDSTVEASYFTFDNGLTASAATADGTQVIVTTSSQTPLTMYTVTVSSDVQDIGGVGVDQSANEAQFAAFGSGEMACEDGMDNDGDGYIDCLDTDCAGTNECIWNDTLLIWEVDSDTPGTDEAEFLEIFNNTGASVNLETERYYVLFINGGNNQVYRSLRLTGTLAENGIFLIGNADIADTDIEIPGNGIQNGEDAVLLVSCDDCADDAGDSFPNSMDDTVIGTGDTFTSDDGHTVTKIDGIVHHTSDSDNQTLWGLVGVDTQWDEAMNGDKDNESLQRVGPDVWHAVTPTPGVVAMEGI